MTERIRRSGSKNPTDPPEPTTTMTKRTPEEIAAEISALRALKPCGPWATRTAESIALQVDTLEGNVDTTADEFVCELTEAQQLLVLDVQTWMEGGNDEKPSEGWSTLVEQP